MELIKFKPTLPRQFYEKLHRLFKAIEKSDTGRESVIGTAIIFIVVLFLCTDVGTLTEELTPCNKTPLQVVTSYFTWITHLFSAFFVLILFLLKIMRLKADPLRAPANQIIKNWNKILENVEHMEFAENWKVEEDDIENLTLLAINGFGTEYISREHRLRIFKDWYEARPDVFSFICNSPKRNKRNRALGYVLVLPLKTGDHFQARGDVSKSMFSIMGLEIQPASEGGADFVLIQGVHLIDKELRNIRYQSRLVFELLVKIAFFYKDENSVIYSEVFTKGGRRLLEFMGFRSSNKKGVQGYDILELRMNKKNYPNAIKTIDIIEKLRKKKYPLSPPVDS